MTTREESDYRLNVDNVADLWLRDGEAANKRDVARYIEGFIAAEAPAMGEQIEAWSLTAEEFVREVTGLSEGNFMYLVYLLRDIAAGRLSRETVATVDGLPRGLNGYYKRHWRDMKDADPGRFETRQRPVLCFLAIGRTAVSVEQLVEWTGLTPGEVRDVITQWREFLNTDQDRAPYLYRLYHRSFAEFLDAEEDLRWYHGQIAAAELAKIQGF